MNQVELIDKRKPREKHFLNEDGTITANIYDHDVHFEKNGHYEDIDTKIISNKNTYENKTNSFITKFDKTNVGFIDVSKDGFYLKLFPKDINALEVTKKDNIISYKDVINDIEFTYKVEPSRLKEIIKLNCKETVPEKITYYVDTNLTLSIENTKIVAKNRNDKVFVIDTPFMEDSAGNKNNNISYELINNEDIYELNLVYDLSWIKDKNTPFPVMIDPTISDGNNTVYDTYISSKYADSNYNTSTELGLGVEKDDIKRILLKFDLPDIATGDNIVDASAYIVTTAETNTPQYFPALKEYTTVHEITSEWDEGSATWNNMIGKYNERIEDTFMPFRNYGSEPEEVNSNAFNITNLVKKWYSGRPNNGVLLKFAKEIYDSTILPMYFYSKTQDINFNTRLKPTLQITYKNYNGLEDYYSYNTQEFANASSHINDFTGNLTSIFNLNFTTGGKLPIDLKAIYNTNDYVLNNDWGYCRGIKLNYHEEIEPVTISNNNYLKYLDADSSIHYFYNDNENYIDEDGLNLTITFKNNKYIIKNENNFIKEFTKLDNEKWYLTKIIDQYENSNIIAYDNLYRIASIKDANEKFLNITYSNTQIIVTSENETTILNCLNNKINSISRISGNINIEYDNNELIKSIIDETGTGYSYEYYNVNPYKISKITEKGLNNVLGSSISFYYGFNTTKLVSDTGITNTMSFNNYGNLIGITNLDNNIDLDNAYGQKSLYYSDLDGPINNKMNNKLIESIEPTKYTNNLLTDEFLKYLEKSSSGIYNNNHAYKMKNSTPIELTVEPNAEDYTFSGYFKNDVDMYVEINFTNANGTIDGKVFNVRKHTEFEKEAFTFTKPEGYTRINVMFLCESSNCILDYPQIEIGQCANYYNLIQNSDFSKSLTSWNVSSTDFETNIDYSNNNYSIVSVGNTKKAIKLSTGPTIETSLSKRINESGKKGDTYVFSFWYKNEGIVPTFKANAVSPNAAYTHLNFNYIEGSTVAHGTINCKLNCHEESWQYFSEIFIAEDDYDNIDIFISHDANANDLYITNVSLSRDASYTNYQYDLDNGNLLSKTDFTLSSINNKYDIRGNLISSSLNNGYGYKKEYFNDNKKIKSVISNNGVYNEYVYDEYGNTTKSLIKYVDNKITENTYNYYIRCSGTNDYLHYDYNLNKLISKEISCNIPFFIVTKKEDYYTIKINKKYITIENNEVKLSTIDNNQNLFKLIKEENGSYIILPKENEEKVIYVDNQNVKLGDLSNSTNYHFYFESLSNDEYIESSKHYTEDGRFVDIITDSLDNKVYYETNNITGLTEKIKYPNDSSITYNYDSKNRLNNIMYNNRYNNIEYDENGNLSKLITNNKNIEYSYDNFLNQKDIKLNNKLLVSNTYYAKTHLLKKKTLIDGTERNYIYDECNRLKKYETANGNYEYYYAKDGTVSKVKSEKENYEYFYDLSKRITKTKYNEDFITKYKYNDVGDILNKEYQYNEDIFRNEYTYDVDGTEISSIYGNNIRTNYYDKLGRIVEIKQNELSIAKYEYLSKGKKTSCFVKKMIVLNDVYEYKYDNSCNVIEIICNSKPLHSYKYDKYNQLIEDIDYKFNKTYKYKYDISGNIIDKKEFDYDTNALLKNDKYQYDSEDNQDLLTKYNNAEIHYDNIGNPTSIGDNLLTWVDGSLLSSFINQNKNLNISYKYNMNGLRTSKTVNGVKTEYYLEQDMIILEKTPSYMIHYLRDSKGSLYGLSLNNAQYTYLKNLQDDIIGIIDENDNLVCKYNYDAWGNILEILDSENNIITDQNSIAYKNKYRYRSYFYDDETDLYYLKTRYYSPKMCRFISSDIMLVSEGLTYNLFFYSQNNPITNIDDTGSSAIALGSTIAAGLAWAIKETGKIFLAAVGLTVAIGVAADTIVKNDQKNKKSKEKKEEKKDTKVYALVDNDNVAHYVGITNNADVREYQHQTIPIRENLKLKVLYDNKTRYEARNIEEALIVDHDVLIDKGLEIKDRLYQNKIHSISPTRSDYSARLAQGRIAILTEPQKEFVIWKR